MQILKTMLYGYIWLMLLSPYMIFVLLSCLCSKNSVSFIEIIGVLGGTYFYYDFIWMDVRKKFKLLDDAFVKAISAKKYF